MPETRRQPGGRRSAGPELQPHQLQLVAVRAQDFGDRSRLVATASFRFIPTKFKNGWTEGMDGWTDKIEVSMPFIYVRFNSRVVLVHFLETLDMIGGKFPKF